MPQVVPRPVLSTLALSVPLAPADFAPEGLEGDALREGMLLAQLRLQAAAAEAEAGTGDGALKQVLRMVYPMSVVVMRIGNG